MFAIFKVYGKQMGIQIWGNKYRNNQKTHIFQVATDSIKKKGGVKTFKWNKWETFQNGNNM